MREAVQSWPGDEWERFAVRLLHLHYPPGNLQAVPARDRGDLGIDAFSTSGEVFQCYAAEEPLSITELYTKQRNKMNSDLKKLENNEDALLQLLGNQQISRWVFLVPRHESRDLISYAARRAKELRLKELSHLSEDFQIMINTAEAYPDAMLRLNEAAIARVHIDAPIPSLDEVEELAEKKPILVETLEAKLCKLPGIDTAPVLKKARDQLLVAYLRKLTLESHLWKTQPMFQRDVEEAIGLAEYRLPLRYGPAAGQERVSPRTVADDLARELEALLPGYRRNVAEDIAWGTVGDWLMRCPLDWEEPGGLGGEHAHA